MSQSYAITFEASGEVTRPDDKHDEPDTEETA